MIGDNTSIYEDTASVSADEKCLWLPLPPSLPRPGAGGQSEKQESVEISPATADENPQKPLLLFISDWQPCRQGKSSVSEEMCLFCSKRHFAVYSEPYDFSIRKVTASSPGALDGIVTSRPLRESDHSIVSLEPSIRDMPQSCSPSGFSRYRRRARARSRPNARAFSVVTTTSLTLA